MVRKNASGALLSARKHAIIKDMQAAIARGMAAQSEVPKSMPTRIAELVREMHRRLRDADQGARRSKGETLPRGASMSEHPREPKQRAGANGATRPCLPRRKSTAHFARISLELAEEAASLALRRSQENLSRLKVEWGPIWTPAH